MAELPLENVTEPTKRPINKWALAAVAVVALAGAGLYKLRLEANGLRNVFSPAYWRERANGRDLFSADNRFLKRGNRSIKAVAFTFDDGPHPESCIRLLDVLKENNVHATFFVVGKMVKLHPDLVKRMLAEGHEVGNHTQDHLRLDKLTAAKVADQLDFCAKNVKRATGADMYLFRPPGMAFNQMVLDQAKAHKYVTVGWTVGAKDFTGNPGGELTPEIITERVMKQIDDGGIILLHDNPYTVAALPGILAKVKAEGYKTETISEMLGELPTPVKVSTNAGFKL